MPEEPKHLTHNQIYRRNQILAAESTVFRAVRMLNNNGLAIVVDEYQRKVGIKNRAGEVHWLTTDWRGK